MGRSFGSASWLIPATMPPHAPPAAIVRREGAFVVTLDGMFGVDHLLEEVSISDYACLQALQH